MIEVEVHFAEYSVKFNYPHDTPEKFVRDIQAYARDGCFWITDADSVGRVFYLDKITHITAREVTTP